MIQAGRSWKGDDFLCPLKIIAGVFIYFFHALLEVELKQPLIWETSSADTTPITLLGLHGLGCRNSNFNILPDS